jgi:hypothetical protein
MFIATVGSLVWPITTKIIPIPLATSIIGILVL